MLIEKGANRQKFKYSVREMNSLMCIGGDKTSHRLYPIAVT